MSDTAGSRNDDPAWVDALAGSLQSFHVRPLSRLLPLPLEIALADVAGVFGKTIPHRSTRVLIISDLAAALDDPRNQAHLPPALVAPNRQIVPVIRKLVADPLSVLKCESSRRSALTVMTAAIDELAAPASLEIRWDELVRAFRSGHSTWKKRVWMVDRFRCAWVKSGRDWTFLPQRLTGVLRDSAIDIRLVRKDKGDIDADELRQLMREEAGLTLDQRLHLCREVVGQEAQRGNCIVWLLFSNARTGTAPIVAGNVTFFDGPLFESLLRLEEPDPRLPPELREHREHHLFRSEDLEGDIVAARVQLDDYPIDSAVDAASTLSLSLVRHASLYSQWVWRLRQGHITFVDGRWAGGMFDPGHVDEPSPRFHNPRAKFWVAEELALRGPAFSDRLLSLDPEAAEVAELLGDLKEIIDGSAQVRALMVPRVLERIGALVGHKEWPEFLRKNLRDDWAARKVADTLVDDAYACLLFGAESGEASALHRLNTLVSQVRRPDGECNMRAVIPRLKEASLLFEVGSPCWMRLRDAAEGTETGTAACKWISQCAAEFDALVSRLERCRHGLMHGWPVPREVLESVSKFAAHLAVQAVGLSLEGILHHGNAAAGFRAANEASQRLQQRLAQSTDGNIGDILFSDWAE